ncbi:MAG TPA: hypothetical protein VH164_13370 [Ktedonobacteraceae bacterium]|nr:hypothetical protein [Ktedonobacteraceae bacterium]
MIISYLSHEISGYEGKAGVFINARVYDRGTCVYQLYLSPEVCDQIASEREAEKQRQLAEIIKERDALRGRLEDLEDLRLAEKAL